MSISVVKIEKIDLVLIELKMLRLSENVIIKKTCLSENIYLNVNLKAYLHLIYLQI